MDTTTILLALFRACIVGFGLYFGGKYVDAHPPKSKFFRKSWKKDKRSRAIMIKYAWLIGIISFFIFLALANTISWWR